jgi:hypothetical protein
MKLLTQKGLVTHIRRLWFGQAPCSNRGRPRPTMLRTSLHRFWYTTHANSGGLRLMRHGPACD